MYTDTSKNLGDLMLDLAREVREAVQPESGVAAQLPSSDQDRVKLRDAINDAGEDFCTARGWAFLSQSVSVTCSTDGTGTLNVSSDPRRYKLPIGFSGMDDQEVSYTSSDGSFGDGVSFRHQRDLDSLIAQCPTSSGPPAYFTVRPCDDVPNTGDRRLPWELVIFPIPDQAYVMSLPVRRAFTPMIDKEERPVWAPQHDRLVVAMAKLRFAELWPLPQLDKALLQARIDRLMASAVEEDERNNPRVLGRAARRYGTFGRIGRYSGNVMDENGVAYTY